MGSRGKADKKGRSSRMGAFTPMIHEFVDSVAFRSLSPLAQCLYWRLRRRAGYNGVRNGEVFYSVREAADDLNVHKDTVSKSFHELQARGFIVAVQIGYLGSDGHGKASIWRLTELPTPNEPSPTKDYLSWQEGHDFPVEKGRPPTRAKQTPVPTSLTARPAKSDVSPRSRAVLERACPTKPDVSADIGHAPVLLTGTPRDLPGGRGQT